jgi:hypothetical protein
MSEEFGSAGDFSGEEKKSRPWLWIVIIGVVLFCCVCGGLGAGGYWLWNNGDQFMELPVGFLQFASMV